MLIKACLNGSRRAGDHPALPLTAEQLASAAASAVATGARAVHVHPRDEHGAESLEPAFVHDAVVAIRDRVPDLALGVTTGAWIEPDPDRRLHMVSGWEVLPDFASVNFSEPGAEQVAEVLLDRGVGVEAGLWTVADAERLLRSGLARECLRLLVEPREEEPDPALATAGAIEAAVRSGRVDVAMLVHGREGAAWPVLEAALGRSHDVRIGLEDTLLLPDGSRARDNAELVAAARHLADTLAVP